MAYHYCSIAGLEIATEAVAFATKYFRNATKIFQAVPHLRPIYRSRELSTLTISWIIKDVIDGMQSLAISVATFVSELLNFAVKTTSYCQNVSRARFLRGTFFIFQKSISRAQICCWTQLTTTNRSRCRQPTL